MFFKQRRIMNQLERECYTLFKKMKHEFKITDFRSIVELGESYDRRPYVAEVGFRCVDVNTPTIKWYCRSDGNIWAAWQYNPGCDSRHLDNYSIPRCSPVIDKLHEINDRRLLQIPMSHSHKLEVNKFTHELWTMHKLGSETLL